MRNGVGRACGCDPPAVVSIVEAANDGHAADSVEPVSFVSLGAMWLLAIKVVTLALDDAIGAAFWPSHGKKRDAENRQQMLRMALEAQVWLMTPSEGRDLWFTILGVTPPTPISIIPILFAWQETRSAVGEKLVERLTGKGSSIETKKRIVGEDGHDEWVTVNPYAESLKRFWSARSHPIFSYAENGSDEPPPPTYKPVAPKVEAIRAKTVVVQRKTSRKPRKTRTVYHSRISSAVPHELDEDENDD